MEWLNEGPGRMSLQREKREAAIRICRDVMGNTLHLRNKAATYLPKFPKEQEQQYERRVESSVLFNWFKRTVGGLTGMVMRKDPKVEENVPQKIVPHLDDIDLTGRDLPTFASDLFRESWADGLALIFVDKPPIPEGTTRDQDLRPYWITVRFEDVLGINTQRIAGKDVATAIRWKESAVEIDPTDEFKEIQVPRVREYKLIAVPAEDGSAQPVRRVQWRAWKLQDAEKGKKKWVPDGAPAMLGVQMDEIPIAPVYTGRVGAFDAEPPLVDLAAENIRHFQKLSDQDNVEHVASVPILVTTGVEASDVKGFSVGPTVGMALPKDADAKYVEITGAGLDRTGQSLKDSEHRMALLGLSMLYSESRAAETYGSKKIDKAESDSQLAIAAKSLQAGLTLALYFHAKWMGLDSGGEVKVNTDFELIRLDAQMITALAALVPAKMSLDTFWELLVQGEILSETFDPETERQKLEEGDIQTLAALAKATAAQQQTPPDPNAGGGDAGS